MARLGDGFQFHKGTIRTPCLSHGQRNVPPFQFHKGTIRTLLMISVLLLIFVFQFHKGTIRTNVAASGHSAQLHFNSIKVRLELILQF